MYKKICLLVFICFHITVCSADEKTVDMKKVWKNFIEVVQKTDCNKFYNISSPKVYCYECLENTPKEKKELRAIKSNDSNWYKKIYTELIFIPKKIFCEEDLKMILSKKFLQTLKTNETIYRKIDDKDFEVLVTTLKTKNAHEGMQYFFRFKKYKDTFLFSSIGTIP